MGSPANLLITVFSGDSLAALLVQANARRRQYLRPGTWRNYISATRLFLRFLCVHNCPLHEPSQELVLAYIELLVKSGHAVASVKNAISAIKTSFGWMGLEAPPLSATPTKQLLRAVELTVRRPIEQKLPFTLRHLHLLCSLSHIDSTDYIIILKAATTIGFFGMLRASNITPQTASNFDPSRSLTWGDVTIHPDLSGFRLRIKWTKSMQTADQLKYVTIPCLCPANFCPLHCLLALRNFLPGVAPHQPLLLNRNLSLVTQPMLRAMLARAVPHIGLDPARYNLHSLRRGGCQLAYNAGADLDAIKRHGAWRSDAIHRYLRTQADTHSSVLRAFHRAAASPISEAPGHNHLNAKSKTKSKR